MADAGCGGRLSVVDAPNAGLTAVDCQIRRHRLTIDWLTSYVLPPQRHVLALLSLFAGSFGADGLAALLSGAPNMASIDSQPARQLWGLHTIGLLHEALGGEAAGRVPAHELERRRYSVHPLAKEHAAEFRQGLQAEQQLAAAKAFVGYLLCRGEQLQDARRTSNPLLAAGVIALELPNWLGMLQQGDGSVQDALNCAASALTSFNKGLQELGPVPSSLHGEPAPGSDLQRDRGARAPQHAGQHETVWQTHWQTWAGMRMPFSSTVRHWSSGRRCWVQKTPTRWAA